MVEDVFLTKAPYVGGWFSLHLADEVLEGRLAITPKVKDRAPDLPITGNASDATQSITTILPGAPYPDVDEPYSVKWETLPKGQRETLMKLEPIGDGVIFWPEVCKDKRFRNWF